MSQVKCHRESYESGGSQEQFSRLVKMNKVLDLFCLRTSKRISVGELIRVYNIYVLPLYTQCFCIVYHHFVHFYVCYLFLGDIQGRRSRNKQLGVKRSNFGQSKRACRDMVLSCRSMKSIIQKPESYMLQHGLIMPRHAKTMQKINFVVMPQHAKSMPRHEDPDLKSLFLATRF